MYIDLPVITATDYFNETDREIDHDDENVEGLVPYKQSELITKILSCEISIYLLRRASGGCQSSTDTMVDIRRSFINEYEKNTKKNMLRTTTTCNNDTFVLTNDEIKEGDFMRRGKRIYRYAPSEIGVIKDYPYGYPKITRLCKIRKFDKKAIKINNEDRVKVTVVYAPITQRYWQKGDETIIQNGQIRLGGCWFNYDNRYVVYKM